jgi:hypothetical protein
MKKTDVETFEKVQVQLQGIYTEISEFAKKKPDGTINTFKLNFINNILARANSVLDDQNRPFKDFVKFDIDEIPTNSDVTFILIQYINCMEKYRADNITENYGNWYWLIEGQESSIQTAPPKKLKS